jgi:hypothetical protein
MPAPVTAQPAPDAVTAALDRLERPTIASRVSCPARRDGCDCINCMDRDECSIQDDIRALTAARAAHAATVKELADTKAELARVSEAGDRLADEWHYGRLPADLVTDKLAELGRLAAAYRAAREGKQFETYAKAVGIEGA